MMRPARALLAVLSLAMLPRACGQVSASPSWTAARSPDATQTPARTPSSSPWWTLSGFDCYGSDLTSISNTGSPDACRALCVNWGLTCGGIVFVINGTSPPYGSCYLKNAAGPYVVSANPICLCSMIASRLSAAALAQLPARHGHRGRRHQRPNTLKHRRAASSGARHVIKGGLAGFQTPR